MRGQHGREVMTFMTTINMMDLTKILVVLASMASLVRAFAIPRPPQDPHCEDCSTTTWNPSFTDFANPYAPSSTPTSNPSFVAAFSDTYAECALVQELVEKDEAGE